MTQFFVLRSKETGKWIALDSYSGGYPYEVDHPKNAELWKDRESAARYTLTMMDHKPESPILWTLEEIEFSTRPVEKQFTTMEMMILNGWKGY